MNKARKRQRVELNEDIDEDSVDYVRVNGTLCDKDMLITIAKNVLSFIGHGLPDLPEKTRKLNREDQRDVKQVQLAMFGFAQTRPFNHEQEQFTVSMFKGLGLTKNQADGRIKRLSERRVSIMKPLRDDSFKSSENVARNELIRNILCDEEISIISDRKEDTRIVNGREEPLRFLIKSVEDTYELVKSKSGLNFSESLFRKILSLFPEIKNNRRVRMTAQCERCLVSGNIERSLEQFGTDELVCKLFYDQGVRSWFDYWYCQEKTESCYTHKCRVCGNGKKMAFFLERIGWSTDLSEETRSAYFLVQLWTKRDGVAVPEAFSGSFSEILPRITLFIEESKIAAHKRVLKIQTRYLKTLKGFDFTENEVKTVVSENTVLLKWDQGKWL